MNQVADPWPLLMKKFPSTEYALLQEVRNKAGHGASRSADGIAMNLWPSRGLHMNGIEIKSFRSDWLRELKMPEKSVEMQKYCDYWWLVAASEGVVKLEEVPVTWGLMEVQKGRLKIVKDAPKLDACPLDKSFVAALLKRATQGMIPISSIEDQLKLARDGAIDYSVQSARREAQEAKNRIAKLEERVKVFEDVSGVRIDGYDHARICQAVRFVIDGGVKSLEDQLEAFRDRVNNLAKYIGKIVDEVTLEKALNSLPDDGIKNKM